jgi:hypothetical protein
VNETHSAQHRSLRCFVVVLSAAIGILVLAFLLRGTPSAASTLHRERVMPLAQATPPSPWDLEEEIPGSATGRSDGVARRNLGVDANGNVYALWEYDRGIDDPSAERSEIRVASRPAEGPWNAATTLATRGISCGSCHTGRDGMVPASLAVNPAGESLALWLGTASGNSDTAILHAATKAAAGGWSAPTVVCDRSQGCTLDATPPDVALDRQGNGYGLWVEQRDDTDGDGDVDWNLFFAYRPAGGAWGPHERVSDRPVDPQLRDDDGGSLSLAVDAAGGAYALWSPTTTINYATGQSFRFAYRPAGGTWGASIPISDSLPAGKASDPAITVDAAGNAYAVWLLDPPDQPVLTTPEVRFATRPAGGSWQPTTTLSPEPDAFTWQKHPAILADDAGNLYALWMTIYNYYRYNLHFAYRPAGGVWGPRETVNRQLYTIDGETPPSIAVDSLGRVYALWRPTYGGPLRFARRGRPMEIQGRVHAIPETDEVLPIIGAPVQLLRNGQYLRGTITDPPDGRFILTNVPITTNLVISVTLRHDQAFPSTFQVTYGQGSGNGGPVVWAATEPFTLTAASPNPYPQNIVFAPDINDPPLRIPAGVPAGHLDDLGVIYYHVHQAWQLADSVSQRLDLRLPVDIVAFSTAPPPNDGVYWLGPMSNGANAGAQPFINLDFRNGQSLYTDLNRPDNREWHEFGHHVMADTFANRMPSRPGDSNHNGYANPSTTDSWTEGFAEFYSMMVARNIAGDPRPELYVWLNLEVNPEGNYLAWNDEELAVAGLLWDLVDPVDADDASPIGAGRATYADCVETSFGNLWTILATDWGDAVPRAAHAVTQSFGYVYDVKHLYDVLKLQGVGSRHSRGREQDDLDELFIAHGFFADLNSDAIYGAGEVIGRAADAARPERRARPAIPGSNVAFETRDAVSGAAVNVQDFLVEVRFAPPFERYSYSYRQNTASTPGRLFFYGPDPQYQAITRISAIGQKSVSTAPLTVTNAFYWEQMAQQPADAFVQHTFVMTRQLTTFLPLASGKPRGGQSGASAAEAPLFDFAQDRRFAPQGRPCLPEQTTPTPTPTATPTRPPGAPIVESIVPASAAWGAEARVIIYGYFFEPGASPYVGNVLLRDVEYLEPEPAPPNRWRLAATLSAGLAPGVYDVTVVNPGGQAGVLPNGFTITPGATPTPSATATAPPTGTGTRTTGTPTRTPTVSRTPSATATASRTVTPTVTRTRTATPTASHTPTPTVTQTRTATRTPSATATASPTRTPTPTRTLTPTTGWQTIFADGFEAPFPGAWQRFGNPGWGRATCKSSAGSYSAWPAADGTGAVTPCVNNYPNNLNAWLIYGPFSLQDASAAEVTFRRWQRSEEGFDLLRWMASVDGDNFYGIQDSGDSGGWVAETFDLSNVYTLGDLRGRSQVWIGFQFLSDGDINDQGAFLDEVVVRKRVGGALASPGAGEVGRSPAQARRP